MLASVEPILEEREIVMSRVNILAQILIYSPTPLLKVLIASRIFPYEICAPLAQKNIIDAYIFDVSLM